MSHYDNSNILSKQGGVNILCFGDSEYLALVKSWKEKGKDINKKQEKMIKNTASLLRHMIRTNIREKESKTYESYPAADQFLNDLDSYMPSLVNLFFSELLLKEKKGDLQAVTCKSTFVKHCIATIIAPKSFLSPLLLCISVFAHRKFSSRYLNTFLSRLGACSSYEEAMLYKNSVLFGPQIIIKKNSIAQYIFDNFDFQVNTLDGKNTRHILGGLEAVYPEDCYENVSRVPGLLKIPTAAQVAQVKKIPLYIYKNVNPYNIKNLVAEKLNINDVNNINMNNCELLWLYAKYKNSSLPGWNGFMDKLTQGLSYEKCKLVALPFIDAPPSDNNTIYTALKYVATLSNDIGLQTSFVTFDQPLYKKAVEIIYTSDVTDSIANIKVRLGTFHLKMSFLGSIGFIMDDSGLKEVLETCYASGSIDKMFGGHAYSRAVRGHSLVYTVLSKRIFEELNLTLDEENFLNKHFENFKEQPPKFQDVDNSFIITNICKKFLNKVNDFQRRGKTSKLWVQYVKMVLLLRTLNAAEKSGNTKLELESITQMLPYF